MAAIWLCVNVDANNPKPVEHVTKINAPNASVAKLPLIGTPNTVTASNASSRKFSIASTMYGACLPSTNSARVTGVT